ncbi:MAG TPA: excinuclease ABC subunit UvrC [Spirochaetia bacterium]|nr:excinuclease ABC subunit UvrC [Spirochaetia bacterium]
MIETSHLPDDPGCYLFRDREGRIIYIGKAKNLKKRVSSYSRKRDHDKKTEKLISNIDSLDIMVTANEVEALILESSLIKTHQPRYNIDLKDAKQYAYIRITGDAFPRICIARRMDGKGSFFGPFVSAAERDYILSLVKKTFQLRTCRNLPRRPCLRYHIKTCSAPCIHEISGDEYAEQVHRATMVLKGKATDLRESLTHEMAECSETQEYEKALVARNQIHALERLSERQDMARKTRGDEDIINYFVHGGSVYLMVFNVHQGTLANKREYVFESVEEFLEEFLLQYYSDAPVPKELILPEDLQEPLQEYLSLKRGGKVTVTVPVKGAKKRLLDLVKKNIEITFFGDRIKVAELAELLALDTLPEVIECFDISHISGTAVVGSMVQFRGGRPDKKNYRRFRIKTVEGIDDPAAIAEVVGRRYRRLKSEQKEMPDLVIIDGGKGQLNAAVKELKVLDLDIPVIALAKKNEEIYTKKSAYPLTPDRKEPSLLFVQAMRDEAHRFAIAYHRLLRKKKVRA